MRVGTDADGRPLHDEGPGGESSQHLLGAAWARQHGRDNPTAGDVLIGEGLRAHIEAAGAMLVWPERARESARD